jgi:hypothetical protein
MQMASVAISSYFQLLIRADCLSLFGILLLEVGARQQERPNGFELQSYRAAGLQG